MKKQRGIFTDPYAQPVKTIMQDLPLKEREELRKKFKDLLEKSFEPLKFKTMEAQTSNVAEKQSDVLLKQMQENTENLSIVRNEIRDFVSQLYPMPKDPEEHKVKESAEPKSFEEKVQFYLQQQQDILHELKQLKDHLRTFI